MAPDMFMPQEEADGSALFPGEAARRHAEDVLTDTLRAARRRVADGPVAPTLDMGRFADELADFDFAEPRSMETLMGWVVARLEHGVTQVSHPRYFGLFNPAPSFPAECAERIVAQFNPQLASATTSPAAVAMEAHVIDAIGHRLGYVGTVAGHFTSGGSEANFTALICALTTAHPHYADDGVRAFAGRPVFYVSGDAHLAWHKIAVQAGLGRTAMRSVATDGKGRMDMAALAHAIVADRRAGCVPVMIVATAGTTGGGMVDPLAECSRIARANGAWLHVDAAWGGGLIASPLLRPAVRGIELADSVTIDAHKWFATTMACGMFLTRDAAVLRRAFQVSTVFMPPATRQDPYTASLQWSRRFLGLRLFLSLAAAGWDGFAEHVERAVHLAGFLRESLASRGWVIANDSPMAVLCVAPPPGWPDASEIVRRVVQSGIAWISVTTFESRKVVRACITHGQTTRDDVLLLVHALDACQPAMPLQNVQNANLQFATS